MGILLRDIFVSAYHSETLRTISQSRPETTFFGLIKENIAKKHYFCDTFVINRKRQTEPLAVMAEEHPPSPTLKDIPPAWEIAGQARNDGIGSG